MKWYAIDWFGGVKVECEDCHRYTTEWAKEESEALLISQYEGKDKPNWECSTCALQVEVLKLRTETKKLRDSLHEWKYGTGGWFELREIIGKLWWHHPAIDNDEKRGYYQQVLLELRAMQPKPNDVYIDGKLVGSGTSPDAANAIRRLMQQGSPDGS